MTAIARLVRVTGHVQGVFFRAWARSQAERLGLNGWIRNCADGSVEAHVEGDEAKVRWFVDVLNEGSPNARVDHVRAADAEFEGLNGFEVRR
jgi:acylphosphatase